MFFVAFLKAEKKRIRFDHHFFLAKSDHVELNTPYIRNIFMVRSTEIGY
jgi:hypothetical protein